MILEDDRRKAPRRLRRYCERFEEIMLAEIVDPIEEHLGLPINATASVPKTCLYSSMVYVSLMLYVHA